MKNIKKIYYLMSFFLFLALTNPVFASAQNVPKRRPATFCGFLLSPKFIIMLIIAAFVLILLLTKKMKNTIKVPLLLLSTFLFGIAANIPVKIFTSFAMHPSPMCAVTKSILYGFRIPMIVTLTIILILTLIGPKLFCGWICPVGALQELIAMLADKLKIKRIKWNFTVSQAIRLGIFILFIFLSGTAILNLTQNGRVFSVSLYDYINAFHGFEFILQKSLLGNIINFLPFILTVVLSFKLYRPFCYLVCPMGILTQLIEQIALFRVSLKRPPCDDCGVCEKKAPCPTVPDILKNATLRPDCFSCNICVESCPKNAIEFGIKKTLSG
ncbi:MAG: 4Fe-4S binding protein [Candidatus Aminicenantes bacterium]|nr:4Fe-4S binding protein [Candidatus Aminicenantes bacterium]